MKKMFTLLVLATALSGCVTNQIAQNADWGGLVYSQEVAKPSHLRSLTYLGVY